MFLSQIGVGNLYNYVELRSIASYPESTNVLTSPNFTALGANLAASLGALLCNSKTKLLPSCNLHSLSSPAFCLENIACMSVVQAHSMVSLSHN